MVITMLIDIHEHYQACFALTDFDSVLYQSLDIPVESATKIFKHSGTTREDNVLKEKKRMSLILGTNILV